MAEQADRIQELVDRPGESLAVELKGWIDPDSPDGIAKVVKAVLALRNHGGGYLLIGFDNKTGQPQTDVAPKDVCTLFHIDKIQGLITKYASEPFEVGVHFRERNGQEFPVIEAGSDVKTPVATKADLRDKKGKHLIRANKVFVRSLTANNTPSTSEATWKDWGKLVEICFENREADIGRFLRRHLSGISQGALREFVSTLSEANLQADSPEELAGEYLQAGRERFEAVVRERGERGVTLPDHGAWEVALIIIGDIPRHSTNHEFLNLLDSSNPRYTGWPVWVDSRGSRDSDLRPYVYDGAWEAFIVTLESLLGDSVDFWRIDPGGKFYLYRALRDDMSGSSKAPKPLTELDVGIAVLRTAEAIAVGIEFAKAMGCPPDDTGLTFAFRWTRLRNRKLTSWADSARYISPGRSAYQDEVISEVFVPLGTPKSALAQHVHEATRLLFEVFNGFELGQSVTEDLTQRLLERRL